MSKPKLKDLVAKAKELKLTSIWVIMRRLHIGYPRAEEVIAKLKSHP